jgi:hypothetical protein
MKPYFKAKCNCCLDITSLIYGKCEGLKCVSHVSEETLLFLTRVEMKLESLIELKL